MNSAIASRLGFRFVLIGELNITSTCVFLLSMFELCFLCLFSDISLFVLEKWNETSYCSAHCVDSWVRAPHTMRNVIPSIRVGWEWGRHSYLERNQVQLSRANTFWVTVIADIYCNR